MRALPAKPFLASKMVVHDVTLTSFMGNLSSALEQFVNIMCKRNVREGTESFTTTGAVVLEILQKTRGAKIPPTRARVNACRYMAREPS